MIILDDKSYFCECSNLNRRRYAQNDDTLYVAPEDERTDYVCDELCIYHYFFIPDNPPSSRNLRWQIGIVVF